MSVPVQKTVIDMETWPSSGPSDDGDRVELMMDGKNGTWRLFVPHGNADFSLKTLTEFRDKLNVVLADIDREPCSFNAELRPHVGDPDL